MAPPTASRHHRLGRHDQPSPHQSGRGRPRAKSETQVFLYPFPNPDAPTVWLAGIGRQGGRNNFEHELRRLHITRKNGKPNHPTTQGKVERSQQTFKKWLRAREVQPATIDGLQILLNEFLDEYNHRRPHRSLPHGATPAALYNSMPKALPGNSRDSETHDRIRRDRIDKTGAVTLRVNGRMHHLGVGRTHSRTHIILLIQDLNVRIVNAISPANSYANSPSIQSGIISPRNDERLNPFTGSAVRDGQAVGQVSLKTKP